jgi:hypothetical protein
MWGQNFDNRADPVLKRLESLREVLNQDMPKAIAYLANALRTLEAYADMQAPATGTGPATASAAETEPAATTPAQTGDQP